MSHSRVDYPRPVLHGPSYKPLTRVSAGAEGTIPVRNRFGIQYGAAYSQEGWVEWGVFPSFGNAREVIEEIDYLEFMVLGKAGVRLEEQGFGFHLLAGPTAAIPVRCQRFDRRGTRREDCVPDIDFGMTGGIGFDLRMDARFDFRMAALYNHGLVRLSGYGATSRNFAVRGGLSYRLQ